MPLKSSNPILSGVLFAALSAILLSIKGIFYKILYSWGLAVDEILVLRFAFAVPLFWLGLTVFQNKISKNKSRMNFKVGVLCLVAGFFGYYLAPWFDLKSLTTIPANIQRILIFVYPAFVLLLNAVIKQKKPTRDEVISLVLTQLGLCLLIYRKGDSFIGLHDWMWGIIFGLLSALTFSFYILINQKTSRELDSVKFTTWAVSFAFVFCVAHELFFGRPSTLLQYPPKVYGLIGVVAFFCTFIPLILFSEAVRRIGGVKTSLISSVSPVFTSFFAFLILDEKMTALQVVGGVVVIASMTLIEIRKKNR